MPSKREDCVPCRHLLRPADIERTKELLLGLPSRAPEALAESGLPAESWDMLLRSAVESLRGTNAATMKAKRTFISAVLNHVREQGFLRTWKFVGTDGRQDYMVILADGTVAGIEAKGGPDGNNMNIWDRPSWAQEFIVWSLSPESLAKQPGVSIWSGVATRLVPRMVHELKLVDAFVFFDGRCASSLRPCPKQRGVAGPLRTAATSIEGATGRNDWLPAPCVYLFPRTYPHIPDTPSPATRTVRECKIVHALLSAFGVPHDELEDAVHSVTVEARGTRRGTEIKVRLVSRCWPDGQERGCLSGWKPLKRQ